MGKSMVAFYSRAHENYVNGTIQELKVGNTEVLAEVIGELTRSYLKLSRRSLIPPIITNVLNKHDTISSVIYDRNLRNILKLLTIMM